MSDFEIDLESDDECFESDEAASKAISALRQVIDALPEGKHRPGQEEMCSAAAKSITENKHLVASAQTGTGKSLAYLVPAVTDGRPVVVATATKALQDQLLLHDVPKIAKGFKPSVTAVTLKGRSNYLCAEKLSELRKAPEQERFDFAASRQRLKVEREMGQIMEWSERTTVGDRAELTFEPSSATWQAVSVDSRECPGQSRCPSGDECFAERAIFRASKADVVIVNMHLYLLSSLGIPLLPEHGVVVLDEAHELENVASSVFGMSLTAQRCFRLTDRLVEYFEGAEKDKCMAFTDAVNHVFAVLENYKDKEIPLPYPDTLKEPAEIAAAVMWRISGVLAGTVIELEEEERLERARNRRAEFSGRERLQFVRRLSSSAKALGTEIDGLANPDESSAVWVESNRSALTWCSAPIDVSKDLRELVWKERTAILSSATIPPNFAATWGLEGEPHTHVDVASPFDYKANSILYVPKWMPKPGAPGYEAASHDEMELLINAAGGRALVLFSSWKALNEAVVRLRERLPFPVLSQQDLPKPELLRQFAEDPETCLCGTLGLWQGVDVPGESLSLVIVARLPFPRPDDPLLQARRRPHGGGAFMAVDVPIVATRLAQGVGRLIRTEQDRGVVAVLDSRLANARYAKVIWGALPPFRRTTEREQVERFFAAAASNRPHKERV